MPVRSVIEYVLVRVSQPTVNDNESRDKRVERHLVYVVVSYLARHEVFLDQLLVMGMEHPCVELYHDKYAEEDS